jgi:hypothetical protein
VSLVLLVVELREELTTRNTRSTKRAAAVKTFFVSFALGNAR